MNVEVPVTGVVVEALWPHRAVPSERLGAALCGPPFSVVVRHSIQAKTPQAFEAAFAAYNREKHGHKGDGRSDVCPRWASGRISPLRLVSNNGNERPKTVTDRLAFILRGHGNERPDAFLGSPLWRLLEPKDSTLQERRRWRVMRRALPAIASYESARAFVRAALGRARSAPSELEPLVNLMCCIRLALEDGDAGTLLVALACWGLLLQPLKGSTVFSRVAPELCGYVVSTFGALQSVPGDDFAWRWRREVDPLRLPMPMKQDLETGIVRVRLTNLSGLLLEHVMQRPLVPPTKGEGAWPCGRSDERNRGNPAAPGTRCLPGVRPGTEDIVCTAAN